MLLCVVGCEKQLIEILSLSEDDQNSMRYKLKGFKTGVHDGIYDGNVDSNCDSDKDGVATLADWPCGMWIGGNDREEEGTWRWANGHLMSHYDFGGFDPMTGNIGLAYTPGATSTQLSRALTGRRHARL